MDILTATQRKVLEFISKTSVDVGTPPTLRELCDYMGYSSIGSAQDVTNALVKKGFLETSKKNSARCLILTSKTKKLFLNIINHYNIEETFNVPCLGVVPAGNPLEAIRENNDENSLMLPVNRHMFARPYPVQNNLYAVKAKGLSMMGAGILDGDWLVVNFQQEAPDNSIVIARLNEDVTCKRLMTDKKDGRYLKPENEDYENIYAKEKPFEIIGRVLLLQRLFQK